jgi:class III poly(R)-hydroxyalkanoic acid synthase PhaE subunit
MRTSKQSGFGIPGVDLGGIDAGEAVEMAQRYWQAWGDALRSAGGGSAAPASQDVWQAALDRWSQLAGSLGGGTGSDPIDRFAQQARQWFGKMQDVAAQFAGRQASAEDVVGAWRRAMGGNAENPFAAMFSQMSGRGQSGFDQWYEQVAPFLQKTMFGGAMADTNRFATQLFGGARDEARDWLQMPSFGLNREHQERLQALFQAQLDLQDANDGYNALLAQAGSDAFERFERKLAEHSEPGRQLQSSRALFDLWIDAAEEAYAEIALSVEFRSRYAKLVNAQMRVRAGVQRAVEELGGMFGMPTRTEVDAAHRKIAELERELRRLRKSVDAGAIAAKATASTRATSTNGAKSDITAASKNIEALSDSVVVKLDFPRKPASKKPEAKKIPSKQLAAKQAAAKQAAAKQAAAQQVASKRSAAAKPASKKTAQKKAKMTNASRASTRTAAKRSARPSIVMSIPNAPQPIAIKAGKTSATSVNMTSANTTSAKPTSRKR